MEFKMNPVIHRGQDYPKAFRTFQNKRMEYIEQEIRTFDSETLRLFLCCLRKQGRTMEKVTGLGYDFHGIGA